VRDREPVEALLACVDGLDDIRLLVAGAPDHLTGDGWLVLEVGADQGTAVRSLFEESHYRMIEIRPDLSGRDRIALGQSPARPQ
jgi:release factor glutamine methyltransferase